jgi:hypothetical protein
MQSQPDALSELIGHRVPASIICLFMAITTLGCAEPAGGIAPPWNQRVCRQLGMVGELSLRKCSRVGPGPLGYASSSGYIIRKKYTVANPS